MQNNKTPLILGRINGVFGVKGWIKVLSFTRPKENIFSYKPLMLCVGGEWQKLDIEATQIRGDRLLMKLTSIDTPEAAHQFLGSDLGVNQEQLPHLPEGEYYWHQLIGLNVFDLEDRQLGQVIDVLETGANDVLVIKSSINEKQRVLIPLLMDVFVKRVDLDSGAMQVDWQQAE